jgi:GT2 family glycosyltransferase
MSKLPRPPDHRELIHTLNQRYYREWLRAQQLTRELGKRQAWGPLLGLLRRVKRWLFPQVSSTTNGLPECPTITEGPMPTNALVSVIIPFRDRRELLRGCVRGLRLTHGVTIDLVLVDNDSRDPRLLRSLDRLQERGKATVVSSPGAFNFSLLCNAGAHAARGDYLLFLNNDTEVCHGDWLERMLRVAARPDVGIVGATLLYPDQTIQHAGLFPAASGRWVHVARGLPVTTPGLDRIRVVPAVTGACLLARRSLFIEVGGFDERLPVTYSDVELCTRVRERGRKVVVTPFAQVLHYEGLSRGFADDEPGAAHLESLSRFPKEGRRSQGWQESTWRM